MKKTIIITLTSLLAIGVFTGCSKEITGSETADNALASFNAIVEANEDKKGFHEELQHWGLALPGDDKFEWSKDTSANGADFAMVVNAEPLITAGLDPSLLSSAWMFEEATEDGPGKIIHPYNISDERETSQGSEDAFRRLLKQNPEMVQYNAESREYILSLDPGYEVHWTEELGLTDADLTFVLPSQPIVDAGLDATAPALKESGWVASEGMLTKTYDLQIN